MATLKVKTYVPLDPKSHFYKPGIQLQVVEFPVPRTQEQYDALIHDPRYLAAPQHTMEELKALYDQFGYGDFDRWIPIHTQNMNIAFQNRRKYANTYFNKVHRRPKPTEQERFNCKVEDEARRRIEKQQFEAAVQRKIQELTPAGS